MDAIAETQFREFAERRWPDLVRATVFLGAGAHEAEDLAQQTLIRCYTRWTMVSAAANVEAYVYRILLNQLRDARRTRWWRGRVDVDPETADAAGPDGTDGFAVADAVHRALEDLTKPQREVVVLRYFVQLTEAQTAEVLGIPAGTVKSRLSRSLAQLASSHQLADLSEELR